MQEMDFSNYPDAGSGIESHIDENVFDADPALDSMSIRCLLKRTWIKKWRRGAWASRSLIYGERDFPKEMDLNFSHDGIKRDGSSLVLGTSGGGAGQCEWAS
jgi:hypothetical protein